MAATSCFAELRTLCILGCIASASCGTGGREGVGSAPHGLSPTLNPPHEVGPKVSVVLNDKQVDVGLNEIPHAGTRIPLRTLWNAGLPTDDPMLLHFDLYDIHGFHPATSPACRPLLNGSDFAAGWMDVKTHDIGFDDALSINDCYRMHAVVRIVGFR